MAKVTIEKTGDLIGKTQELVIVPVQQQIGARFLLECLNIIDAEHIIRSGRYRDSILPITMPTVENPTIEIASVDCPYAGYLEYGTRYMKARAVFRRAIEIVKDVLSKTIKLKSVIR